MENNRLSVEEAKNFWFEGDLVAYAFGGSENREVISLPKKEVERGLYYLRKLKACSTYGEAQQLYLEYSQDNKAPKLIPRLENLENHYDFLLQMWDASDDHLPQNQDPESFRYDGPSVEMLITIVSNKSFEWDEAPPYLDDNEYFAACRDMQRWTDAWIPREIAAEIGEPDTGFGIDYYEAEYLYKDKIKFIEIFARYGIHIEFDNKELLELAGLL
jgi:hypothetical protein